MSNRELGPIAKELIAAKKRIENPKHWWDGTPTTIKRGDCAVSSLGLAAVEERRCLRHSAEELFGMGTMSVNDTLGHAAVMQIYDHAIAKAVRDGK